MSELFILLHFVRTYIDDLLVITKQSFDNHLEKLELVLKLIQKAGLKINAEKSEFCMEEVEYLGFMINRQVIRSIQKKVDAILKISLPKSASNYVGLLA